MLAMNSAFQDNVTTSFACYCLALKNQKIYKNVYCNLDVSSQSNSEPTLWTIRISQEKMK